MQKQYTSCQISPEAGLPCTELFGSLSPVYEEEIDEEWPDGKSEDLVTLWEIKSSDHSVLDAWELLQEYGDLNCNTEDFPELYDICVNINDVCRKDEGPKKETPGPTLAELNERRALSPLINPDMRRLHMEATETGEPLPFQLTGLLKDYTTYFDLIKPVPKTLYATRVTGQSSVASKVEQTSTGTAEGMRKICKVESNEPPVSVSETAEESMNVVSKREDEEGASKADASETGDREEDSSDSDVSDSDDQPLAQEGCPPSETDAKIEAETVTEDADVHMESDNDDEEEEEEDDFDSDEEPDSKQAKVLMAKGRRSEAEDWTPNPAKLIEIGKQLDRLNRVIRDLRPINQLPVNSRNKTRREKNKLASRACRLKKKAGHEANKIKLRGLEMENELLKCVVQNLKDTLIISKNSQDSNILKKVDLALGNCVAGKLTDFVDTVIKKAASGDFVRGFKHQTKSSIA